MLGGLLVAAGLALNTIFYILAGVALLGAILTLLVPPAALTTCTPRPSSPQLRQPTPAQAERVNPTA